jgi:hypothetical protein
MGASPPSGGIQSPTSIEQEYEGIYVAHWEVSRFVVSRGGWFFGLVQIVQHWQPVFPEDFAAPIRGRRDDAAYYRMKLRGTLGPRGFFGHMGICRRQLFVKRILSCDKTEHPGKVW